MAFSLLTVFPLRGWDHLTYYGSCDLGCILKLSARISRCGFRDISLMSENHGPCEWLISETPAEFLGCLGGTK